MSDLTTIARPYAKAAFDFALEKGQLDLWSQQLAFAAEAASNEEVLQLLSGASTTAQATEIFLTICSGQFDEYGQNLVRVMAENGRLTAFPEICSAFLTLKQEHEKTINVDITSAVTLSGVQKTEISKKLELRFKRKVLLNCSIDEALLSGVIIRAGDLVIDNSTRGRLNRLSDALNS